MDDHNVHAWQSEDYSCQVRSGNASVPGKEGTGLSAVQFCIYFANIVHYNQGIVRAKRCQGHHSSGQVQLQSVDAFKLAQEGREDPALPSVGVG